MIKESIGQLKISRLTENFYVFTTYSNYQGSKYPANGMYVVSDEGVLLFDSPWDTTQFQPLLDTIMSRHKKPVVFCIATHFHEDRTAGLEFYKSKGVKTYTTIKTDSISKARGMKRGEFMIGRDTTMRFGQYSFEIIYPGPGHAPDNIIAWFGKEKILYGGCLIKSTDDKTLGNLGDANLKAYAGTLKYVERRCPDPHYIIPGHNSWKNKKSLKHSRKMAEKL